MNTVAEYFDSVAKHYRATSSLTPSGWVRSLETRAIVNRFGNLRGKRVLEIGCGRGHYTRLLAGQPPANLTVIDLSQQMLNGIADLAAEKICGDFLSWSPARQFDFILCAGTLEFMPDPSAFFAKARLVGSMGAKMLLLCPRNTLVGRGYRAFHQRHGFKISLFSDNDLETLADSSGWKTVAIGHVHPYAAVAEFSSVEPTANC